MPDKQAIKSKVQDGKSMPPKVSFDWGIKDSLGERGLFAGILELPKSRPGKKVSEHWALTLLLIVLAYSLSVWIRYNWIDFAEAHYVSETGETEYFRPQMVKDGIALPNTHDSFYFGSIIQKALSDSHEDNHLIPSIYANGVITYFPYLLLKAFPAEWTVDDNGKTTTYHSKEEIPPSLASKATKTGFTIEDLLLKLPVWVAGLVCIPVVLIGRFYGSSLWGFFAACLAGVAHSYYNRTLAGYYDTDMFSITMPAFALCFLLVASRRESVGYLVVGAMALYLGRFFYTSTAAITCTMCLAFIGYRMAVFLLDGLAGRRKAPSATMLKFFLGIPSLRFTCLSVIFIGWALYSESWSNGKLIEDNFLRFWFGLLLPVALYFLLKLKSSSVPEEGSWAKNEKAPVRVPLVSNAILSISSSLALLLLLFGVPSFFDLGPFSGTWAKITSKMQSYSSNRTAGATVSGSSGYNLHFKDVKSTIREAGSLDQQNNLINNIRMRNRILEDLPLWKSEWSLDEGEKPTLTDFKKKAENYKWFYPVEKGYPKHKNDFAIKTALLALVGYLLLCIRYWEFCIAVPFWGIGYHCFTHFVDRPLGLRFTVHVGNVAALGLVFLLLVLVWALFRYLSFRIKCEESGRKSFKYGSWGVVGILVFLFALPNIEHAKGYYSHVVYPVDTIKVLDELNKASDPDDFVVTWWDYGSGCWFYGDVRTFTSPAHQTVDNFLTSEILRSTSHLQGANLARLKAETFVRMQKERDSGKNVAATAVQEIFKDGSTDLLFYQGLLGDLKESNCTLPEKTRDVFLFMPYEILRIFPTILSFSSRNLYFPTHMGKLQRDPPMTILRNGKRQGNSVVFDGGHRLDRSGALHVAVTPDKKTPVPYTRFLVVDKDGEPAEKTDGIEVEGLKVSSSSKGGGGRTLIFVRETFDLVILSAEVARSDFAKRFFLDQFDLDVYQNPLFASSANPRKAPFMGRAERVQFLNGGKEVHLAVQGLKVVADLTTRKAKVSGSKEPVPFSFHRRIHHQFTGEMTKYPSIVSENAKFHLIQTNLPGFRGQPEHIVQTESQSLSEIAVFYKMEPDALSSYLDKPEDHLFHKGTRIIIPAAGYGLFQAWYFMDDEAFNSLLVQGFLMENLEVSEDLNENGKLDPGEDRNKNGKLDKPIFEKITSSAWGKVYKILR